MELKNLEESLVYKFKNKKLLEMALSHTSYAHENGTKSNERLEFLGDTVLNFAISDKIYKHNPEISEGNMSKIRATIICEEALYQAALNLHYDDFILLGKGEERLLGNKKPSILADAFEAVLAAIYLDSDFVTAYDFVIRNLQKRINEGLSLIGEKDYKTKLQEFLQQRSNERISYEVVEESGPDHDKKYVSVVKLGTKILGKGDGHSKKDSEQAAAEAALKKQAM